MKELKRMPKKQPPKAKPKLKPEMTQKERFIAYAREVGSDESGERFEKAMNTVIPSSTPYKKT